ncbi:hypothetical protein BATDEDRAFT_25752 [Batrachochytrium dendrobatidis JAM81]|uniref:Transmembrane 9 superfamily member n=1 Tax=Batrachochytrium dendrobatidis (strain JAM81 / FGSC 10211) TaxID=684364 RepID=F4P5I0_BATDJ|nr:uncharacterized protein BATDEDRAFT_25752 [Batrachochytrium dendrobatidis JAM81]EGF79420.1 hypothetical protein BATDEDRAFT_25752 [Batrachochytrium dendrobatidis JAM81]|eukprot:XP_006679870.1 hypothetical protein BATDEDRAFT_25752 [Batrachochytrium dendrobatidis JAM81]
MTRYIMLASLCQTVFADEHTHHYKDGEEVNVWYNTVAPLHNKQETYEYTQLPYCLGSKEVSHYHESLGEALLGLELIHSGMDVPFLETKPKTVLCTTQLDRRDIALFIYSVLENYHYSAYIDNLPLRGPIGTSNTTGKTTLNYLYTSRHYTIMVNKDQIVGVRVTEQINLQIAFHYSVQWSQSNITFDARFEQYLESSFFEHKIHWFSIINSFMMVIFLVGVVIVILMRTDRDLGDEYGWKLVHGDVFRAPRHLTFFSALNGAGIQLILMAFAIIVATIVGNLYTERAIMLTASIFIYALTSVISGYYSGSMYAKYNGKRWIIAMMTSSLLWPGIVSGTAFIINFIAIYYQTSRAIPFTTMRYAEPLFVIAAGGLLPFGAVFIELYFIFTSFWEYKIYYVYGFMLLVYILLIIVTICVSIVATYFLLNAEDHRWHWTVFLSSGSISVYIFLYSIYYFLVIARMDGLFQTVFYFGYTGLACFTIFCMLGTVGHMTAERFVRSIYTNIKVD